MKKLILISLILGVVSGQAFATYYRPAIETIDDMISTGDASDTDSLSQTVTNIGDWVKFEASQLLYTEGDDGLASTSFGVSFNSGDYLDLSGYEGFELSFANANDDEWLAKLYLITTDGTNDHYYETTGWVTLIQPGLGEEMGPAQWITLDFDDLGVNYEESVKTLGLWIGGNMDTPPRYDLANPSNPDHFAVNVVPLPATILLGFLGLGVGGWRLRKSL